MLNMLCRCFYFWQEEENDSDLERVSSIQRPEVCLDVTRSGMNMWVNKRKEKYSRKIKFIKAKML